MLVRTSAPPLWAGLVVATVLLVAETVVVLLLKKVAPMDAFGVVYVLGVLVVAMGWGSGLAAVMAVVSAFAFGWCRHWAHPTFGLRDPENWAVTAVFLVIVLMANALAGLARSRAAEAEQRRREAEASRAELQRFFDITSALRRVATLVARGVAPAQVFSAVADELARCLNVRYAALFRFDSADDGMLVAVHDDQGLTTNMPVGQQVSLNGDMVAGRVLRAGRAARMNNYENATGPVAAGMRRAGLNAAAGTPIVVDGRTWGVAIVGSSRPEHLPPDIEDRVADFAELVGTAIANAQAHSDLTASRARIVTAGDDARRRIERDLHDGAQQRLVSLGLKLRMAEESVPAELGWLREQISEVLGGLGGVSKDLQELSRGIHPAILSKGGLGPALKTLARRSAVPVRLDVGVSRRLPQHAEVAAYYVAAEALTNAAKHAGADNVVVTVSADGENLHLSIQDDGIGGADAANGSGLIGLRDRLEALGGRLRITSPPGNGTSLVIDIPLNPGSPTR
jgi:signal transduction histidine kinase